MKKYTLTLLFLAITLCVSSQNLFVGTYNIRFWFVSAKVLHIVRFG